MCTDGSQLDRAIVPLRECAQIDEPEARRQPLLRSGVQGLVRRRDDLEFPPPQTIQCPRHEESQDVRVEAGEAGDGDKSGQEGGGEEEDGTQAGKPDPRRGSLPQTEGHDPEEGRQGEGRLPGEADTGRAEVGG